MAENSEKLSWRTRIGYGMGDIYGGGAMIVVGFYYLIFLTDVVGISPALAGTVILISKIYDSITDPFEGLIADRTRTRLGRRRPYLLAGIPLVFLSFFALFYPFNMDEEMTRFFFVILSYLFFSTVVSLVSLNYNALQAEITLDYNERSVLSSARIFFLHTGIDRGGADPIGNRQSLSRCAHRLHRHGAELWRNFRVIIGGHRRRGEGTS